MATRFRTEEEFNKEKDRLLELVVPHRLHPDLFEAPKLALDEIAVLWAKDKDDVKTKMTICKIVQKALRHARAGLEKYGITSLDDALDITSDRERGEPVRTVNAS